MRNRANTAREDRAEKRREMPHANAERRRDETVLEFFNRRVLEVEALVDEILLDTEELQVLLDDRETALDEAAEIVTLQEARAEVLQ